MPNVLWPIFQQNRHLLHDLPALGASVIQQYAKARYGARVLGMVVPHSFGRHLTFNAHLHILVSAGGLKQSGTYWVPRLRFKRSALMHMWRYAVITYLREALKAGVLSSDMRRAELSDVLTTQYERWWSIDIDYFQSKAHFLRYAGRYVRRPPIAQHRFVKITNGEIHFRTKDLRQKKIVITKYSATEFVRALGEHVPDRYRNAIRYFGLLAPRSKEQTADGLLTLLRQHKRTLVKLSWAASLRKHFNVDPLVDSRGRDMRWVGRMNPTSSLRSAFRA
jgi:hypothetical protein